MGKRARQQRRANEPKPYRLVPPEHPVLRQRAHDIDPAGFGPNLREYGLRLCATASRFGGMAVAAPQIGDPLRVLGVLSPTRQPHVIVNPVIVARSDEIIAMRESCLTFPGRWFLVPRHTVIGVESSDPLTGERTRAEFDGVYAQMFQHEIDHLNGDLIIEGGRYPEITGRRDGEPRAARVRADQATDPAVIADTAAKLGADPNIVRDVLAGMAAEAERLGQP